jgi:DUF2075 family protein
MRFIYSGSIEKFNNDVLTNSLADQMAQAFYGYYHRRVAESEYRAWQESLRNFKDIFHLPELDLFSKLKENPIILECELPNSSSRIDVLLFGSNIDNKQTIVLIELKQWSNNNVDDCATEGNVIVKYGRFKKEVAHPSLQVEGYHFYLKDFYKIFSEDNAPQLHSCSYCHNYSRNTQPDILFSNKFQEKIKEFPIFSKEETIQLGKYLESRLSASNGAEVFNRFLVSPIEPSRTLRTYVAKMINKQRLFNLVDDQIAAYNAIMYKVKNLSNQNKKSVVIIKGGPGTGKTAIALEVMTKLLKHGNSVVYAAGSSAMINTLRKIIGSRAQHLFKFFNTFFEEEENTYDVAIFDEAHRLRDKNINRYRANSKWRNIPQVEIPFKIAKLSIFLIDENQVIRPDETCKISLIKETAKKFGINESEIAEFELKTQFRCSGSDVYLDWIDNVLGIRKVKKPHFDKKMEFRIFETPQEMMEEIRKRNKEKKNSARITAGFCWPWSDPNPDGTLVKDVKIGDFEMPWENKKEFWKFATDDSGMEQVGTVYTVQGFDFDYIGVIFGNDLVYDYKQQKWQAIPEHSYDTMVKRNNPDLTKHLLNTYRILLTRGMKGVYIYFMDKDTEKYFREKLDE